jgi:hypothetical protein
MKKLFWLGLGAQIKVSSKENGMERSVYRDVNSGASFGSNPLMQHIGMGTASVVDQVKIKWPVSNDVQVSRNIQPNETIKIKRAIILLRS